MIPFLDAETVRAVLPIGDAVDVVAAGYARHTGGEPLRTVVDVAAGQLLLMPSETETAVGVKVVSVGPGAAAPRIQGVYVLLDAEHLTPRALMDGSALTALRTPAVSAVATDRLAIADARRLVVLGAGPQAEGHVHAMRAVRPVESVRVLTRSAGSADDLVGRLRAAGVDAGIGAPEDLAEADVVCACTTSRVPVVTAAAPHAHVNAVGSHEPDAREVDGALVAAAQIAVETRAAALAEAGDLLLAGIGPERISWDLGELVRGEGPAAEPGALSLFKSVGIAYSDLLVAEAVFARWL